MAFPSQVVASGWSLLSLYCAQQGFCPRDCLLLSSPVPHLGAPCPRTPKGQEGASWEKETPVTYSF